MKILNQHKNGFTIVEVILVILTLAIIGGAGYLVAKHIDKNSTNLSSSKNNSNNNATAYYSPSPPSNTYLGWKSYCGIQSKACFYYPNLWTAGPSIASGGIAFDYTNVEVTEFDNTGCNSIPVPQTGSLHVLTINNMENTKLGLFVIGGYWIDNQENTTVYNPEYMLVNSNIMSKYNPKIGNNVSIPERWVCLATGVDNLGAAFVNPMGSNGYNSTTQDATTWLNSTDTKNGLLILQSLYLQ